MRKSLEAKTVGTAEDHDIELVEGAADYVASLDVPRITDIDGWPTVGETYLVLCARMPDGKVLPTYGPAHQCFDHEPGPHYHVDPRFLTVQDEEYMEMGWRYRPHTLNREPISYSKHPDALKAALSGTIAMNEDSVRQWLPRVCRYRRVLWDAKARDANWNKGHLPHMVGKRYIPGTPVDGKLRAIIKNGKPTCPHQGFDLRTVWDGKSRTVRCPLHGIRVDMSRCLSKRP